MLAQMKALATSDPHRDGDRMIGRMFLYILSIL